MDIIEPDEGLQKTLPPEFGFFVSLIFRLLRFAIYADVGIYVFRREFRYESEKASGL